MSQLDEPCFPPNKLPVKAKVNLVEETADRVVIEVAPGGKTANVVTFFAVFWNLMTIVFTLILGADHANDLPFALLFGTLFGAVGIGIIVFAVRLKCTHTLLLFEHEKLAIRSTLLGRSKTELYPLNQDSYAQLVRIGESNGESMHRVDVNGSEGTARFGSAISEPEKQWLRNGINRFLSSSSPIAKEALHSRVSRAKVYGRSAHPVDPVTIDQSSIVRIEKNTGNTLRISWATIPPGRFRTIARGTTVVMVLILLVWASLNAFPKLRDGIVQQDWFEAAFAVPPMLSLLFVLTLAIGVWRGRTFVLMSEQTLTVGVGVGLVRWKKTFQAADAEWVAVADEKESSLAAIFWANDESPDVFPGCVLQFKAADVPIPLTPGHPKNVNETVGGLVRWHCDRVGVELPEPGVAISKEPTTPDQ